MSGYKIIKKKKYDKDILDLVESIVSQKRDKNLSLNDAKRVFGLVKNPNSLTVIEERTIKYIKSNFDFQKGAKDGFKTVQKKSSKSNKVSNNLASDDNREEIVDYFEKTDEKILNQVNKKGNNIFWYAIVIIIFLILFYFIINFFNVSKKQILNEKKTISNNKVEVIQKEKIKEVPKKIVEETTKISSYFQTKDQKSDPNSILESTEIYFVKNDNELDEEDKITLKNLAEILNENQKIQIKIMGFASNEGSRKLNENLAFERGEMVMNYLAKLGVKYYRMNLVSKVINKDKKSERKKFRKVTFRVTKK